jgi:3-hydroxymyristoyl/3-hydroxydecanoyl-(acyl carrier protein) dehydratase
MEDPLLIPLASHGNSAAAIACRGGRIITAGEFASDVALLAARLPARRYLINLCADRYRFAVGLGAALLRNQVSLLPPSQAPEILTGLMADYQDLYALADTVHDELPFEVVPWLEQGSGNHIGALPGIPADRIAAIAFTSGSTGKPTAHPKSWGALARGAAGEALRLGLPPQGQVTLVATVPPQHMYGLESSVLMALRNGLSLHAARPFYPDDVRASLAEVPGERVLVTTPVHLRALVESEVVLPALRLVVCATAPLSADLAARAEARFGTNVHEIYGFTEAGMVASRRTTQGPPWRTLPDVRLSRNGDAVRVSGGHVEKEVSFSDVVELHDEHTFTLHGRGADVINVAGKRTSLAYLNHQLNSIEGVLDGVFFMPDESREGVTRPIAFAVAPGLSRDQLVRSLRARIDAIFLPRPLYLVGKLPRNATGKLERQALQLLVQQAERSEMAAADGDVIVRTVIAVDHPAAAGHFPGNPIMPGVVLLDEVLQIVAGHTALTGPPWIVKAVKFLRPVRPGEEMVIRLRPPARGQLKFECSVGGALVVSGAFAREAADEP